MPKLPRVSGAQALHAPERLGFDPERLGFEPERLGFEKVRQKGSHLVMRHGAKGCVIPLHAELKVVTLAGRLRQAAVSPEEFVAAL